MAENLFPDNKDNVNFQTKYALFHDQLYGLNEMTRYNFWNNFQTFVDSESREKKNLFWLWELKTYFGLDIATIQEMENNWNSFYSDEQTNVFAQIKSGDKDIANYAYWQWATGNWTSPDPSFVNTTTPQFITGYPEFSFWLSYYCAPENQAAMSQKNYDLFSGVKMYRDNDSETATNNMEYLFYLPSAGEDPPATSLFNITTLKQLISLGQSSVNII